MTNPAQARDNMRLSVDQALRYISRNHLDKTIDNERCHFCEEKVVRDKGTIYEHYIGEIGEFWSKSLQKSVLAHPDCLPYGMEGTYEAGAEWVMA